MGGLRRRTSKWLKERTASRDMTAESAMPFFPNVKEGSGSREKMFFDYQMIGYLFPDFPKSMLDILVVRERGNMKAVALYLLHKGWGKTSPLIDALSSSEDPHFTVKYFWGLLKESYLEELKTKPTGTYFTAIELPNNYSMFVHSGSGEILKEQIKAPSVEEVPAECSKLKFPLERPFVFSKSNLIPWQIEKLPVVIVD